MKYILEHSFNNSEKFEVLNILSIELISTHHKRQPVVFTGSSEWMNYMYTLWLGSTNFPKTLGPFQKPRWQ